MRILPDSGSICVYNKHLEISVFNQLRRLNSNSNTLFDSIFDRIIDLEVPFKHHWLYLREFKGKSSFKSILPALYPNFSYDQLELSSGKYVNEFYEFYCENENDSVVLDQFKEYSRFDTYGMFLIYKKLTDFIT